MQGTKLVRLLGGVCLALAAALPLAGAAQAQAQAKDAVVVDRLNIGERIAIAGRQRMLAQGMARSLCFAEIGVDREESLQSLYIMWNLYSWYHRGLHDGNPQLRLFEETDTGVRQAWQRSDLVWASLKPIYAKALQGRAVFGGEFVEVIERTEEMADRSTDLVAALRGAYADQLGPRGFGTALLIDLYERQRMLAQEMTKEVCLLSRRYKVAETQAELTQVRDIFDLSLGAFLNGMADAGVPPPPSPEIRDRLARAKAHWDPVARLVGDAALGRPLSAGELSQLREKMDLFLSEMTIAINLLVAFEEARN